MADVNSRFASISESEILRIQDDAVLQNTKRATKFGLQVFNSKRRLHTNSACLRFSGQLLLKIKQPSRQQFVSLRLILFCRAGLPSKTNFLLKSTP